MVAAAPDGWAECVVACAEAEMLLPFWKKHSKKFSVVNNHKKLKKFVHEQSAIF